MARLDLVSGIGPCQLAHVDNGSCKHSSCLQISWTCARPACKSSTGRIWRIIWPSLSGLKKMERWIAAMLVLPLSQTVFKDQTRCFPATMLQPMTSRKPSHLHRPGVIDVPCIVSKSRAGVVFFHAHLALFLESESGNQPTWEITF